MAFQTDKTRVASLILARDLSALYYPFLDVREAHHGASHNDTSEGYERIARFHLTQFAYLAKRLDDMPEGEGTVLDNCCLMYLSNMFSGSKHDNTKVPLITAGGLGGTLETAERWTTSRRRQQPQAVQPVSRHHGPYGCEARPVRRRRLAAERPVAMRELMLLRRQHDTRQVSS